MATNDIIGPFQVPYGFALLLTTCLGIALYNAIELTILIFYTFKRYEGLYFYSLIAATWGILVYTIGMCLRYFSPRTPPHLYCSLMLVGWTCMVTGQALVLYSRLHLLQLSGPAAPHWVLALIIFHGVACHVGGFVLVFGAASANPAPYRAILPYFDKLQTVVFFVQELIISGLYVWKAGRLMRSLRDVRGQGAKQLMRQLMLVNVAVMGLSASLVAVEFVGLHEVEAAYKALVYSIKLKMEFAVLNGLLHLFKSRSGRPSTVRENRDAGPRPGSFISCETRSGSCTVAASPSSSTWYCGMSMGTLASPGLGMPGRMMCARDARVGTLKMGNEESDGRMDFATFLRESRAGEGKA